MAPPSKQSTVDRRRRNPSESTNPNDVDDSSGSLLATPPSSNLWVGNLSLDTTESELSALFAKYGALDRVTAYPSRNYAFVYFKHVEDARAAKETLQGALVRGNQIKIQYAKPAKSSKHLWIGRLSPAVTRKEIEEAFSKFGEIAELKQLKDRNSAFVDYYKVEDAADAMKNMNGKFLRGEQISVDYVRSLPSRRDSSDYHDSYISSDQFRNFPETSQSGHKRPLLNVGRSELPTNVLWIKFPMSFLIDEQQLHNALILFGEIEKIKTIPGRNCSFVEFRSPKEALSAKEGLEGRLFNDPRIQILFSSNELNPFREDSPFFPGNRGSSVDMHYNEPSFGSGEAYAPSHLLGSSNFSDGWHPMGWRRPSPSEAGILPSPAMLPSARPLHGAWDEFDGSEPKRPRIDGAPFHSRRMDSQDRYVLPQPERDSLSHGLHSPIRMRGSSASLPSHGEANTLHSDHCWRGLIAKGGTPVCHARCLPIGKGLESPIPEVVNCSARTGLDMLAKHCAEANGFDIVFFLPDSEEDFASYTEFLRYLGGKKRAGVAKFDDGTTLFLVPPSDFLTRVLNVSGPERLYGVVLRMPPIIPPSPPQYVDRHHSQIGYNSEPQGEDLTRLEYRRGPREDLLTLGGGGGKLLVSHDEESHLMPPTSLSYNSNNKAAPPVGLSLTPELIATLASLAPSVVKSSVSGTGQLPLNASTKPPVIHDIEQTHYSSQQTAHVNAQAGSHLPQFSNYGNLGTSSEYPIQSVPGLLQQSLGSTVTAQHVNNIYSLQQGMPMDNANQQYHPEASYIPNNSYGVTKSADMNGRHHNSSVQQQSLSSISSSHVQSVPPAQVSKELPPQLQQLQTTLSNSSQTATTGEVDKNQRYQSTLQFAANLLKQIQQKQPQGNQE